jgi:hypothetical protein
MWPFHQSDIELNLKINMRNSKSQIQNSKFKIQNDSIITYGISMIAILNTLTACGQKGPSLSMFSI